MKDWLKINGRVCSTVLLIFIMSVLIAGASGEKNDCGEADSVFATVAIDPGHGGRDPGAIGSRGVYEKDVVLGIGLRLKGMLEKKGFHVVMTRDKDELVPLKKRAEIANSAKADAFISLHANASRGGGWGFETYFLSQAASDDAARKTAMLENGVVTFEQVLEAEDMPPEVNEDIAAILLDMAQTEYVRESEFLAVAIQDKLAGIMKSPNRGIKQAPFTVLMGAEMPAVLVEIGFVSSRKEVKLLTQPKMQNNIAKVLSESISDFAKKRVIRMGMNEKSASTVEKEL